MRAFCLPGKPGQLFAAGLNFVSGGEKVRVVGGYERKHGKVAGELETLARNDAATMGGNTVQRSQRPNVQPRDVITP